MSKIKVAIVGVGNCASALLQGLEMYKTVPEKEEIIGLMNYDLGGYKPGDIEVVAAFDIDKRKVGKELKEALFALPNCTKVFFDDLPAYPVTVRMGHILDSIGEHSSTFAESETIIAADQEPCSVKNVLQESGAEILLNYLPVGSEQAARFYAEAALEAGVGFINAMPVFIASDPEWEKKFKQRNLPLIGDDVKGQLGATVIHRTLARLFENRGVRIDRCYQLNFGGNTDFLNMLNQERLSTKKKSKTQSVQAELATPLPEENIHIGPSDYIPWLKDHKICHIQMEGRGFGGIPISLELKLAVEDSPNSGGVTIDAIRCMKLALDRGLGGALVSISAFTMKSPPLQFSDNEALMMVKDYIEGSRER